MDNGINFKFRYWMITVFQLSFCNILDSHNLKKWSLQTQILNQIDPNSIFVILYIYIYIYVIRQKGTAFSNDQGSQQKSSPQCRIQPYTTMTSTEFNRRNAWTMLVIAQTYYGPPSLLVHGPQDRPRGHESHQRRGLIEQVVKDRLDVS